MVHRTEKHSISDHVIANHYPIRDQYGSRDHHSERYQYHNHPENRYHYDAIYNEGRSGGLVSDMSREDDGFHDGDSYDNYGYRHVYSENGSFDDHDFYGKTYDGKDFYDTRL